MSAGQAVFGGYVDEQKIARALTGPEVVVVLLVHLVVEPDEPPPADVLGDPPGLEHLAVPARALVVAPHPDDRQRRQPQPGRDPLVGVLLPRRRPDQLGPGLDRQFQQPGAVPVIEMDGVDGAADGALVAAEVGGGGTGGVEHPVDVEEQQRLHRLAPTRCACGLTPCTRLKAALSANGLPYPTFLATEVTVAPGSRSRSAASASRHPVRYAIGGSPTSSVNRRASEARETPTSAASAATVHGRAGSCCMIRMALPTTGSLCARYHAGASWVANQLRSGAMSSRSSIRSSTASCPGSALTASSPSSSMSGPPGWMGSGVSAWSSRLPTSPVMR